MPTTVIDCTDLDAEVGFFTERVGFRMHLVTPADAPRRVVIERDGVQLELRRSSTNVPVRLRFDDATTVGELRSPGGSIVEMETRARGIDVPESVPTLTVVDDDRGGFGVGRAGMEYRDLLPDRWGGRFIASHIRIADGGDVADWVHFHRIRFQMIFVAAGWVDVVYEDQGDPFRMHAGDCVLQPPEIRHRVLRSSPGLEVIEVGCPAAHDTLADHELTLPTPMPSFDREFAGQRFVRHVAADAVRSPWVDRSFVHRDTGIGQATAGLAGAIVVSSAAPASAAELTHHGEFLLLVGLAGHGVIEIGDRVVTLAPRTSVALPPGSTWTWTEHDTDHEALVVSLPADAVRAR